MIRPLFFVMRGFLVLLGQQQEAGPMVARCVVLPVQRCGSAKMVWQCFVVYKQSMAFSAHTRNLLQDNSVLPVDWQLTDLVFAVCVACCAVQWRDVPRLDRQHRATGYCDLPSRRGAEWAEAS
jgi:hypothetical protein